MQTNYYLSNNCIPGLRIPLPIELLSSQTFHGFANAALIVCIHINNAVIKPGIKRLVIILRHAILKKFLSIRKSLLNKQE